MIGRVFAQVSAVQNPVPGATGSVNTVNPGIQVQGAYGASAADAKPVDGVLKLGLHDAISRGIRANLSGAQYQAALREARGQSAVRKSALLPGISGNLREVVTKTNLRAFGVRLPGAPTVVGPFNYFDLRVSLAQSLYDRGAIMGYKASQESVAASEHRLADARDIVVLAVSGTYLQALAAEARIRSLRAQLATARTLFDQASQQNKEGLIALVDANRSQVELQTQEQRLITSENDFAKQKLNLARMIGLAPGQQFELTTPMPPDSIPPVGMEEALKTAYLPNAPICSQLSQPCGRRNCSTAARERSAFPPCR